MTASTLRSYTCKDLAQMARNAGVSGWHAMRKDELVAALVQAKRRRQKEGKPSASGANAIKAKPKAKKRVAAPEKVSPARKLIQKKIGELKEQQADQRDISTPPASSTTDGQSKPKQVVEDRLVVMVRDPYWLHAVWELTPSTVSRARSAMGPHWHSSRPVLRLLRVTDNGTATLEREIPIHGGVSNWYLDVQNPPCNYRLEIGYSTATKDSEVAEANFYCLCRSNTVTTPAPGSAEVVDHNWSDVADNVDRIYAMSGGYSADGASMELQEMLEQRLRRRLGRPAETRFGHGASDAREERLPLAVDAELVVYGTTDPHTHVTIKGEPVPVKPDGSFMVKMHLPDRRQVIPVVAGSSDGVEQKTIILGVERNTKLLDGVTRNQASR